MCRSCWSPTHVEFSQPTLSPFCFNIGVSNLFFFCLYLVSLKLSSAGPLRVIKNCFLLNVADRHHEICGSRSRPPAGCRWENSPLHLQLSFKTFSDSFPSVFYESVTFFHLVPLLRLSGRFPDGRCALRPATYEDCPQYLLGPREGTCPWNLGYSWRRWVQRTEVSAEFPLVRHFLLFARCPPLALFPV